MKRFVLAASFLLVAALVAVLAWWSLRGPAPAERAQRSSTEDAPAPTSSASGPLAAAELEKSSAGEEGARSEVATTPAAAPEDARGVRGRVVEPPNCADERRTVYALARASTWGDVVRAVDPRREDDAPEELQAAFGSLIDAEREKPDQGPRIVSQAALEPDGTFRVWFPAGAESGWVAVGGDFQLLEQAAEVDFAAAEVVLHPACGAAVRVRVTLPDDGAPAELDAEEIATLAPNVTGPGAASGGFDPLALVGRAAHIDGDTFEFRALPAAGRYRFRLEPKRLAALERAVEDLRPGQWTELTVRVRRGATIAGVVLGTDRAPIAEATVRATLAGNWFGFDDRIVRRADCDAEGRFELLGVPAGKVGVVADHGQFLECPKVELELADGGRREGVELVLDTGASIAGSVSWPDGAPVADAEVKVSFDLSQMYGMGAMGALRGGGGKTRTDAEGKFRVQGLGAGPFTVVAMAQAPDAPPTWGEKPPPPWRARKDGVAKNTKELALVLHAPSGVRGTVASEDGAPIAKFKLFAQRVASGPLATFGQDSREEEFESADGSFFLTGLSHGNWKLTAHAEGHAPIEPVQLELPRDETREDLRIVLPLAAEARGFVRDQSGKPVANAEVVVDTGAPNWQRFVESGPKPPSTRSKPDGSFALDGLRPIAQKLSASARGHAKSLPVEVDLAATRRVDDVVIVMRNGATLTGEVFDDAGRHAGGWMVQVTDTTNFDQRMEFTDSDGRFRFEHLEPGSRQVVAMPAGAASAASEDGAAAGGGAEKATAEDMSAFVSKMKMGNAELADGETTHLVLGAPPKDPVQVRGRVTHAGEPYAGAMVAYVRSGAGAAGNRFKSTTTDKDGAYALQLAEPGAYTVSVQRFQGGGNQQNVVEFARTVPQAKETTIDLALPTGRISGLVRGDDGKPVSGARVSLGSEGSGEPGTMWGGHYNETATDAEGRYDIQALRPGRYTVQAGGMTLGGAFGDDSAHGREAKNGVELAEGEWRKDVDFRLRRPGTIDVDVVDESGKPVSGASVFVRARGGELVDRFSLLATGVDGTCKYGGLAPGRYTVTARAGARASAESGEVEVRSGERTPARVVLATGSYVLVKVVDAEEKPLVASLSVRDEAGREVGGMYSLADLMQMFTDGGASTEEQRLGPFPAGKYRVTATLSDGRTLTRPVSLSGQAERKLNIRF